MDLAIILDDALWERRIVYKAPIGTSPYWLKFRKAYCLPVELEHQSYWAVKKLDLDANFVGQNRMLLLHNL